ncbi:hypothetical protein [Algoriphagus sp.]|uniref:hypothetical protein n=1 Tax=Algoriphagus sp. TaxID=1872435 RepID=UPI0025E38492|nr:hypothetical protein [Algoriphagus sp.]
MSSDRQHVDLNLWKDNHLFKKQHRLKLQFWEIFSRVAENISDKSLLKICSKHKSIKLSRGNDLLGMPYHVLDIIRNFDPKSGLNIRVLNWFGNGMFLMILTGNENSEKVFTFLHSNNFYFGLTDSPWDYPGLILENQKTKSPDPRMFSKKELHVWVKELKIEGDENEIIKEISQNINLHINQYSKIFGDKN